MADMVKRKQGKVVGTALILLGVVALWEAWRLYGLRTQMVAGAVVGDDTFPLIVGVALVVFGATAAFLHPPAAVKVSIPYGEQRGRMLASGALLVGYWLIVPYAGYSASTVLVAIGLFRAMGGYRWPVAVLMGGVTTGVLHLLFRVWLLQPLPTGLVGV
ncbi:MAG: tripartite tricarboxylate transporter TctB family protein [Candidatus Rokubacteria bacterium]|nr:tripartite tricarboxylate transporter TctB family protein [Candidatus Rokubacteria bacterium]